MRSSGDFNTKWAAADKASREIDEAEAKRRNAKTARLRAARLEKDASEAAANTKAGSRSM